MKAPKLTPPAQTLGDILPAKRTQKPRHILRQLLGILLLTLLSVGPVWWWITQTTQLTPLTAALYGAIVLLWLAITYWPSHQTTTRHWLVEHDRQGFMHTLHLNAKTAIIDGSNIYHFGHDENLDAIPLGMIADQLRQDGYRVVSFFDANIFYTLRDHGAFASTQHHSLRLLKDIFGLDPSEVYIAPSGTQADKYILETLKYLPKSFAVTNDQFRDYRKAYVDVMKGDQWRKGVMIKGAELKLKGFKFKSPLMLPKST